MSENPSTSILRKGLGLIGGGSALFSLMFVAMAIANLLGLQAYESKSAGVDFALLILFSGTTLASFFLARWGFAKTAPPGQQLHKDEQIRLILNLAQRHQGELSLLEVAAETQLSLEQSKTLLEELVTSQLAQMDIRQDGVMLYVFPEFRPETPPSYQLPGE